MRRRKILQFVSPLSQHHLPRVGRAEDEDVEGHRAQDYDDDEDSQEDSFLVTLLARIHQLLDRRSHGD